MNVSVIIPLYNKAPYIQRAIDSVLKQTFQDFEVIVVDDGSTDDGAAIAQRVDDTRVRVLMQANRGAAAARNAGIRVAQFELAAFLDADDAWDTDFLKTAMALYRAYPQAAVFATAYTKDFSGKRKRPKLKRLPHKDWCGIMPDYFKAVLGDLPVISSAVMIKRCVFDAVGFFKEGAALGEDQDMWCRIALKYPIAYSTKPCAVYYMNTAKSTCYNRSIVQAYPVVDEVVQALAAADGTARRNLTLYLSKLRIDYAVRLIRAHRFRGFFDAMAQVPSPMPARRLMAYYYLLKEIVLMTAQRLACAIMHNTEKG